MNIALNSPSSSAGRGGGGLDHLDVVPDAAGRCAGLMSEFLAPRATQASAPPAPAPAGLNKRKRRPAGTPDPDAEVVALSPKTLMESDRYVCEICNQGFQRDQNLQMHRRRHKVPWKLLKRPSTLATTKRVYICPERSCLHHNPAHALGDLVGIKKHFRRKHSTEKQWKCDKCSKGYAVQSDYKAHLKICGTRGHCCDCGRVFSRVESFIEHQDTCSAVRLKLSMLQQSGGERSTTSEGNMVPHTVVTDTRISNESTTPSQSSDTTSQAMSADTAARRVVDHGSHNIGSTNLVSLIMDEHARRLQQAEAVTPCSSTRASIPAWLVTAGHHAHSCHSDHHDTVDAKADVFGLSRSGASSNNCAAHAHFGTSSTDEVKKMSMSILEPSLQLSIGPSNLEAVPSPFMTDIKPSFSSSAVILDREALGLNISNYHDDDAKSFQPTAAVGLDQCLALARDESGTTLGRRCPDIRQTPVSTLMSGFQLSTAQVSAAESSAAGDADIHDYQSTKPKRYIDDVVESSSGADQMVSFYNPACGGTSASTLHREKWAAGNVQDIQPDHQPARRGMIQSIQAQLEPATSSVAMTNRQGVSLHNLAAITDRNRQHLVEGASTKTFLSKSEVLGSSLIRSQNLQQMAAASRATPPSVLLTDHHQKAAEVMDSTYYPARCWPTSDVGVAGNIMRRMTTDEARQECEEAEKELARAEMLKREAREQLLCAAAEKDYAERARDAAKRQVEVSEAELEKAKRLRTHSQAELQKAAASSANPLFCHSCKSIIDQSKISSTTADDHHDLSIRSALSRSSTSPTNSWSMINMAPSTRLPPESARFRNPAAANRLSWSESIDNFGTTSWHAHPGSYNVMTSSGMTVVKSPPSQFVSSPEQSESRRDGIARTSDLDLN